LDVKQDIIFENEITVYIIKIDYPKENILCSTRCTKINTW